MLKGTVNELGERNSGTIHRVGIKDDIFFHADALVGTTFRELKKGDKVAFEMTESKKGPYATKVQREK